MCESFASPCAHVPMPANPTSSVPGVEEDLVARPLASRLIIKVVHGVAALILGEGLDKALIVPRVHRLFHRDLLVVGRHDKDDVLVLFLELELWGGGGRRGRGREGGRREKPVEKVRWISAFPGEVEGLPHAAYSNSVAYLGRPQWPRQQRPLQMTM